MITISTVRPLNKKYGISKERFWELYWFCMQYDEWKQELKYNIDTVTSIKITDMPKAYAFTDPTAELAIKRDSLKNKCKLVETTAAEVAPDIADYLLYAVTHNGITYNYLNTSRGMPCSHNYFYEKRKIFYYLLNKKQYNNQEKKVVNK